MRLNTPFAAFYQNYQLTDGAQSPAGDGINNWGLINAPTIVAGKNSANAVTFDKPMGITPGTESFQNAYFDPDQPTSRVHDWNLTVEKEAARPLVRAACMGNHCRSRTATTAGTSMPTYVGGDEETAAAHRHPQQRERPDFSGPFGNSRSTAGRLAGQRHHRRFERYSKGFPVDVHVRERRRPAARLVRRFVAGPTTVPASTLGDAGPDYGAVQARQSCHSAKSAGTDSDLPFGRASPFWAYQQVPMPSSAAGRFAWGWRPGG
jgi:hypothetical protein